MNEQPIPEAALRDENSVEMLRVWIAEKQLHCSMTVGMYHKTYKVTEEKAWGVILADVTRHLAMALESRYGAKVSESIEKIREHYMRELNAPTSEARGKFTE
jgi:hypothetical protein